VSKFYITTAIDYVNSRPHLGTAYEKIGADAIARYRRLRGDDTFFMMGNDEHSINVKKAALAQGLDPVAYCDRMEEEFRRAWKNLDLSYDAFIRTTQPRHAAAVQEIYRRIKAKGDIYKSRYKGLYCVSCEAFKEPSDLKEGRCPNHAGTPIQEVEEENYFFRLSKYQPAVAEHIRSHPRFVRPETRRNEILSFIDQGLKDLSITRYKFGWGVPLPDDPDHTIYVWFDALINYVSGAGFPHDPARFGTWWPADLHVIGKDITRFHCVWWPAMLMAADLAPPESVWGHGFVYFGGEKFSKSKGKYITPDEAVERYGADAVRYFLLREVPWDRDGEFSWEKLQERYDSDLANDWGNLLNRTVDMAFRFQDGELRAPASALPADAALKERLVKLGPRYRELMDDFEMHTCLAEIWDAVRAVNGYIEACKPWALNKAGDKGAVSTCLYNVAESLRILTILLSPFMPAACGKFWEGLGLGGAAALPAVRLEEAAAWGALPHGTKLQRVPILFPKNKV
jgi:methionyl-tRNA synthetase